MTTERNGDSAFDFLMRKQHGKESLWDWSLRIATMFWVFDVGKSEVMMEASEVMSREK
jgi:hypothetical protein